MESRNSFLTWEDFFQLQNRRYIGNKYKLTDWIFSILNKAEFSGNSFADVFARTGTVGATTSKYFNKFKEQS